MSVHADLPAITLASLRNMKTQGERFSCLTAYDATFARLLDEAGVDVLLVGDSLGMVIQGHETTLPVTVDDMVYHLQCVSRGRSRAMLMADMPFMSDASPKTALHSAARLMQEGGAHIVKIEGGEVMAETVSMLSSRGIPVCAHLGLQPQSIHKLGGYRVQGKEAEAAQRIVHDASLLEEAGAEIMLLECVSAAVTRQVMEAISIPVIGIGAGPATDGQVLVLQDVLGITAGHTPKFVQNFMAGKGSIRQAIEDYVQSVKAGRFPTAEQTFS